ncbi:unnamed protein product [Acanthoscelides obtectus]|uniref:Protein LTV1 homolog n=1 Tax=Acanthoscelides obtectus TaxID=200917 RepID=A0A9P0PAW9_ACAOB|nr:unnamed protein product [Acanthoscelides obtectus]CAK1682053.1 Protein LTV1 homolog [Acanthoscelides obtectus]
MPKLKKIDKKKAVTFQLVHRSQQDPLIADEDAPQRVLVPIEAKETRKDKENRIDEQHKYGIYYDDDCNYLDYLKDTRDNTLEWPGHVEDELSKRIANAKLKLPSTVFASEVEDNVGMLAKAPPTKGLQLHLDPDLVAAMDDDFDYNDPENQLEDNFIELANGVASDGEFDENDENELDSNFDDEEMDEADSQKSFESEEVKSRFTNYSMTSSVIRRNDQLSLLDDRFEKMYADYEENEIGALDCEEIEGHVPETSDVLLQYAEEFEKSQKREKIDKHTLADKIKERLEVESDEEEAFDKIKVVEQEKWDCESILSTYSNLYNHPKLICEPKVGNHTLSNIHNGKIQIDKRTGIPKNVLGANKLTAQALNKLNEENGGYRSTDAKSHGGQSIISQLSELSIRPKDETPEERRDRKKQLKEYRKERRVEKKANSLAFKEEAKRQSKIVINNKNNVQGNRIL